MSRVRVKDGPPDVGFSCLDPSALQEGSTSLRYLLRASNYTAIESTDAVQPGHRISASRAAFSHRQALDSDGKADPGRLKLVRPGGGHRPTPGQADLVDSGANGGHHCLMGARLCLEKRCGAVAERARKSTPSVSRSARSQVRCLTASVEAFQVFRR
jgi:hypothetical protein